MVSGTEKEKLHHDPVSTPAAMAEGGAEAAAAATVLVALGGNLDGPAGRPADSLLAACQHLSHTPGITLVALSRFYRSPAFPAGSGPDYVNACAMLRSALSPQALLSALHGIEAALGRVRDRRWGARAVDLDLIAVGDAVCPDAATQRAWQALAPDQQLVRAPEGLILPHPRMQDRAFVLAPLAEIAAQWRHPLTKATVAQMLAALPADQRAAVRPFAVATGGVHPAGFA